MGTVQRAAQVLEQHTIIRHDEADGLVWFNCEDCGVLPSDIVDQHPARMLADAGLLADTTCRKCSGTGGTDLSGARCAVCDGSGHRRADK
jgi:hypothetical protein